MILPQCSELLALLFTDDTALLVSDDNRDVLFNRVKTEFKKVVFYFRPHKLALHPIKTKFMNFCSTHN
jgi:hypothetical protein